MVSGLDSPSPQGAPLYTFMRSVTVDRLVWFSLTDMPIRQMQDIASELTLTSNYADDSDDGGAPIKYWQRDGDRVGFPLAYGMKLAEELGYTVIDNRVGGLTVSFPRLPSPRHDKQRDFFTTLTEAALTGNTLAVAPTGTGKTVAGLNTIARIGKTALVVVPSKNLAKQWKDRAIEHLGLSDSDIHIFSKGKCAWSGYKIVVAVIHNLCRRDWPTDFYQYFGVVIWDEAHRVGARFFSRSVMLFPAAHRIALTATPDRKDGMTTLVTYAFGDPDGSVRGTDMEALPCTVYVLNSYYPIKTRSSNNIKARFGMLTSAIANCAPRNELCASVIRQAYDNDHIVIALSDRIEQLKAIRDMLINSGIPSRNVMLFIGSKKDDQLDRAKTYARIILATYGMMKEGQDIPHADFGVDLTPRSDGNQALGRIRRVDSGKTHSTWVTVFDHKAGKLAQGISASRIKDYRAAGAEVININQNLSLVFNQNHNEHTKEKRKAR